MLTLLQSIVLGIIQGITEWLPISSSGHLVLAQKLFSLEVPLVFDIWLHIATLLVIILFFHKDIARILKAVFKWQTQTYDFRLAIFVIIGSIITASVVLVYKSFFEKAFSSLLPVALAFLVTGTLLFFSEINPENKKMSKLDSALIGASQGIAFLPGMSRSGLTISTALILGIKKEDAFRFSFLLVIPPAIAASIMKISEITATGIPTAILAAGFITAMAVSFLSLSFLKKIVLQQKFHYFAYYCWLAGLVSLILHYIL